MTSKKLKKDEKKKMIRGLVCKETGVLRQWGVKTNVWLVLVMECIIVD